MNWLDPLNKVIIQKAVKAQAKSMILRDGREFTLNYKVPPFFAGEKVVLVKPARASQLVPMGYFNISRILLPEWLKESSVPQPTYLALTKDG